MKTGMLAFLCVAFLGASTGFGQIDFAQGTELREGDRVKLRDQVTGKWLSWYRGNWVVVTDVPDPGPQGTWIVSKLTKESSAFTLFQFTNVHSGTVMDGNNDNSVVLDSRRHSTWFTEKDDQLPLRVYASLAEAKAGGLCYSIFNKDFERLYYLSAQTDNDVVLRTAKPSLFGRSDGKKIYVQFIRAR